LARTLTSKHQIGRRNSLLIWNNAVVPDLVTIILILVAAAAVVGCIIWNLDRIRNEGADPLVNPAWTILVRPSQRWFTKRRPQADTDDQTSEEGRG